MDRNAEEEEEELRTENVEPFVHFRHFKLRHELIIKRDTNTHTFNILKNHSRSQRMDNRIHIELHCW